MSVNRKLGDFMDDRRKLYQLFVVVVMLVLLTAGILIGFAVSKNDDTRAEIENVEETEEVSNSKVEIYSAEDNEASKEDVEIVYVDIYEDCDHVSESRSNEYGVNIDEIKQRELDKIEREKTEYKLVKDSDGILMFERSYKGKCSNHYLLKLDNNNVVIYRLSEDGEYVKYQDTNIQKEGIRPDLAYRLEDGIEAETVEELYMFLEDLES